MRTCAVCKAELTMDEGRHVPQFCGLDLSCCTGCVRAIEQHGHLATLVAFAFRHITTPEAPEKTTP